MQGRNTESIAAQLEAAGLSGAEVEEWVRAEPGVTSELAPDSRRFSAYWRQSTELLARLPQGGQRSDREREAQRTITETAREARVRFLSQHSEAVYDGLTQTRSRFVRLERLIAEAPAPRSWPRSRSA